jgi:hypothetical protein
MAVLLWLYCCGCTAVAVLLWLQERHSQKVHQRNI